MISLSRFFSSWSVPIKAAAFITLLTSFASLAHGAEANSLSPENWPKAERERFEKMEFDGWSPSAARAIQSDKGAISAVASPVSVFAGLQTLKSGGNAADAAAVVALTQVTRELGSVVSYAGIFTMVYYDAKTKRVFSMDAGYNSYRGETNPMTIPARNLASLKFGDTPDAGAKGRETLVPGFMAGVEAMHHRFGRLPFDELFQPAIWYSEHGVKISPVLFGFFSLQGKHLVRTPEGKQFLAQSGRESPQIGDNFVQHDLAETLKAVAKGGARTMYQGAWAEAFIKLVQKDGGKVVPEDLANYAPVWNEPYKTEAFGSTVYVNGAPHYGAFGLFASLHLAEALQLDRKGAYWNDIETFRDVGRINLLTATAPLLGPRASAILASHKIDASPLAQLEKQYGVSVAPLVDQLFSATTDNGPHHSNGIVVVDQEGNIAAITHTINAFVWGDTGIVVGGIPLPDSAGFQQQVLAAIPPGTRLPHQILDTIVLSGGQPILATASIGSSLLPETFRVLLGVLGQKQALSDIMAAPPLLSSFDLAEAMKPLGDRFIPIPETGYSDKFRSQLKQSGISLNAVPTATTLILRGTVAAVYIEPKSGRQITVEQPDVIVFGGGN